MKIIVISFIGFLFCKIVCKQEDHTPDKVVNELPANYRFIYNSDGNNIYDRKNLRLI